MEFWHGLPRFVIFFGFLLGLGYAVYTSSDSKLNTIFFFYLPLFIFFKLTFKVILTLLRFDVDTQMFMIFFIINKLFILQSLFTGNMALDKVFHKNCK